jgi:GxxExxY protein
MAGHHAIHPRASARGILAKVSKKDYAISQGKHGRTKNGIRLWQKQFSCMDTNDVTYAINGAVFEVNRVLGPGFLEKIYENALLLELKKQGLKAESQVPIKAFYKGTAVGEYIADILVQEKVIVELKTVEHLDKIHEAQLLNYLKAIGIRVGLLVNFRHRKAEIKRMVLDLPEGHDDQ